MNHSNSLLLVIDLQNVYLPGAEWACPSMPEAVKNICRLLDSGTVSDVIFTRFTAPSSPQGTWNTYNSVNAAVNADPWSNDMIPEIRPYLEKWPVYEKSIYSSMRIPEIAEAARKADHLLIAGVVADCCVLSTMMEAIDDGYHVIYLPDCVAGPSPEAEEAVKNVAAALAGVHTEVMDSLTWMEQAK